MPDARPGQTEPQVTTPTAGRSTDPEIAAEVAQAMQLAATSALDPLLGKPPPDLTGGGFRVSPAELQHQLDRCADLLADLRGHSSAITRFGWVPAPASDPDGSGLHIDALHRFAVQWKTVQDDLTSYLTGWSAALSRAKAQYMAREDLTEAEWDRLARGHS
jgi:hypothetical protein